MGQVSRILFIVMIATTAAFGQECDKLESGLTAWKAERDKIDKRMIQAFDKVEAGLKKNKALPAETKNRHISDLNAQQAQFKNLRKLPDSDLMLQATIDYLDALHGKAMPLRKLFEQALAREVGNKSRFDEISAAKEKWQAELPGRAELTSHTEWHGTRTFAGGNTTDFHFHVFGIADNSFKGHIWQDTGSVSGKTGWEFEAKREGNQVLIKTVKMLHGSARTVGFRGYVIGRRIVLTQTTYNDKPVTNGGLVSIWKK